jgi:hypothetical protein
MKKRPPRDPSSELLTALSNGVITMTAPHIVNPARLLGEALTDASPDMLRGLSQTIINALLAADAMPWSAPSTGFPRRVAPRSATATGTGT